MLADNRPFREFMLRYGDQLTDRATDERDRQRKGNSVRMHVSRELLIMIPGSVLFCSVPSRRWTTFVFFGIAKIAFSYFVVIKKLTLATYTLYSADGTDYVFDIFNLNLTISDSHNYLYIAALWLGSGLIYFLDMQIW